MVGSESSTLSNEVAKETADLTSSTGHSDADGSLLEVEGSSGEVSTELLKSADEDVVLHLG